MTVVGVSTCTRGVLFEAVTGVETGGGIVTSMRIGRVSPTVPTGRGLAYRAERGRYNRQDPDNRTRALDPRA